MTSVPVKHLTRITTREGKFTKSVKVTFDLPVAPTSLVDPAGRIHNLYPCRVPYIRCNRCQGHGHSINNCPNSQNTCPHCAGKHTYGECFKKENPRARQCANCKGGHGAAYKGCPAFIKHKDLVDKENKKISAAWEERRKTPPPLKSTVSPKIGDDTEFPPLPSQSNPPTQISREALENILVEVVDTNFVNLSKPEKKNRIREIIKKNTKSVPKNHKTRQDAQQTTTDNHSNKASHRATNQNAPHTTYQATQAP